MKATWHCHLHSALQVVQYFMASLSSFSHPSLFLCGFQSRSLKKSLNSYVVNWRCLIYVRCSASHWKRKWSLHSRSDPDSSVFFSSYIDESAPESDMVWTLIGSSFCEGWEMWRRIIFARMEQLLAVEANLTTHTSIHDHRPLTYVSIKKGLSYSLHANRLPEKLNK